MKRLIINTLLPRIIFIPFILIRFFIEIINIFTFYKFYTHRNKKTKLCIESGKMGWELIECKEILESAKEYLGNNNVIKVSIEKKRSYIFQIINNLNNHKPTHYLYDARTGSQNFILGFFQASIISILFQIYGIIPICTLTDLPVRKWRLQTSIVSCKRGVVVTLMSPKEVISIFPHYRLVGPMTMPFSKKTLEFIKQLKYKNKNTQKKDIVFVGSLYEPRTTILEKINTELLKYNYKIDMVGSRNLGTKKRSDENYWSMLINAKMVITTANQIDNFGTDWSYINHLIYRYLEVPACGSTLVAQNVSEIEKYFIPNIDFISFSNTNEAVEKILDYLNASEKLKEMNSSAQKKAISIIESNLYWNTVDANLKKYSLL